MLCTHDWVWYRSTALVPGKPLEIMGFRAQWCCCRVCAFFFFFCLRLGNSTTWHRSLHGMKWFSGFYSHFELKVFVNTKRSIGAQGYTTQHDGGWKKASRHKCQLRENTCYSWPSVLFQLLETIYGVDTWRPSCVKLSAEHQTSS